MAALEHISLGHTGDRRSAFTLHISVEVLFCGVDERLSAFLMLCWKRISTVGEGTDVQVGDLLDVADDEASNTN